MVQQKASCLSFDSAEDLPIDLIFHILHEHVGLYTFARARQVNRAWAAACDDEKLILSVARYTDGLTRSQFRGLLRLTKEQATAFPSRPCRNAGSLNTYYLYLPATVQRALAQMGGLRALHARTPMLPWKPPPLDPSTRSRHCRELAEREECLHRRAENVRRIKALCAQTFAKR